MLRSIIVGAGAAATSLFPAFGAASDAVLAADRAALAAMLEGVWVNELQAFFDDPRRAATMAPATRDAMSFAVEDGDDTGAAPALAVDSDPEDGVEPAGRWRLSIDAEAGAVRSEDETGCVIAWRRAGEAFTGVAEASCGPDAPASWVLSGDGLSTVAPDGAATTYERAREFSCWTAVLRGAAHGDSGLDNDDWQFTSGQTIHDQGGVLTVTTDETPARTFFLKMRRVRWPDDSRRPSTVLYVHEAGNDRAISYAWGGYDAERIGVNLRWLQASCGTPGS